MRTEEPEAAPAQAAAAAASTRGPLRRQVMKPRNIVHKKNGSEMYSLVRSATETAAEIDRVIAARDRAIMDEAREIFGASMPEDLPENARPKTPEDARRIIIMHRRACMTQGWQDRRYYLVFDFEL